ncbi:MAG: hypothetical protein PHH87_00520 [Desulfuromonas sp.]|nr:hypothetical protein [Desulfuromonas sp.]
MPHREAILAGLRQDDLSFLPFPADLKGEAEVAAVDTFHTLLFLSQTFSGNLGVDIDTLFKALGILTRRIAELSYPLYNVDISTQVSDSYSGDLGAFMEQMVIEPAGVGFWTGSAVEVSRSMQVGQRFFSAVTGAYTDAGQGFEELQGINTICLRQSLQDILSVWLTLWTAAEDGYFHTIRLAANQAAFHPGDSILLNVSLVAGNRESTADLYLGFTEGAGELWYLCPDLTVSRQPRPWLSGVDLPVLANEELFSLLLPDVEDNINYTFYALLVVPGGSPADPDDWVSNLATFETHLSPSPPVQLDQLRDESYLFPGIDPETRELVALPLQRWDFIFCGDLRDNPLTEEDETLIGILIPGRYDHIIVYLGRDQHGKPWGAEMSTHLSDSVVGLRYVWLPEFEEVPPSVDALHLALGPKALWEYEERWAKRLAPEELMKLKNSELLLLRQIQQDWETSFPYQFEAMVSKNLSDKAVQIIDDGREGGANCADYWLSLYEDFADVCIYGTRMSAAELMDFYQYDPDARRVLVPAALNPLPLPLKVWQIFYFGYYAVDPLPHIFPCDGRIETGLPMPSRFLSSLQLVEISPVDTPAEWIVTQTFPPPACFASLLLPFYRGD